ncbi:MAG: dUTP diphosphatase, partial [Candidatus Tectomicrobia bacterium]
QIPQGWYGQIFGRSSVFQRGLAVHPGVIDADYRGPIRLLVYNHTTTTQALLSGDRLAQLVLLPVPAVTLTPVTPNELSQTTRGTGGLGSTGR